ncbi:MAG: Glutamate synthase domain 2 and ferredoxin domain [Candidatus Methanohalarchaeum thermophilum]|uniref:Glutamate synthase domain 2 and ferredoxin domain n=1 Tax=Methanohalarchaeum thermophilum TaxID=1903181 RepID=A0A1Q6DX93_METT1|nr:MAG: Glutamate synthase domain 2 and ferredoxin domain [Candidatus Methanohalarchaeum thermophilum]
MVRRRKKLDVLGTVNRGDPAPSGLCELCRADCKGKCETFMSCLKGTEMLYPRDFGEVTAGSGNIDPTGVGYHSLRAHGFAHGAEGLPEDVESTADNCLYPNVDIETEFGNKIKTKSKVPLMTGALGSTFIAEKYWDSFAIGAALCGFPIVIGENVVGVDREAEFNEEGKVVKAPELDRRIDTYKKYADGEYGGIFVQLNVEDTRNGVAEYIAENYGNDLIIELKWGQGAKSIGGEIQVNSLDYAKFLDERGYLVEPDPNKKSNEESFKHGGIDNFARHSRLGGTEASNVDEMREDFMTRVDYLKELGFKRISLKTGAYGMKDLAMALRFAAEADLDLLTIDGAGGGTGMSPWNMMDHWGVPSMVLHDKAYKYSKILEEEGFDVPDLSFAGGFAREDHLFKALALGSPYVKTICMGRALMVPGFVGANIEGVFNPGRKEELNGNWDELPRSVKEVGEKPEEIFSGWYDVKDKVGEDEMENIPFGAVALWNLVNKLGTGLKQFMAGARKFNIESIDRGDLMSANKKTENLTGIPFMSDSYDEEAKDILKK